MDFLFHRRPVSIVSLPGAFQRGKHQNPYFIRFHIEPKEGISRHAEGFTVTDFVNMNNSSPKWHTPDLGLFITNYAEDYADSLYLQQIRRQL